MKIYANNNILGLPDGLVTHYIDHTIVPDDCDLIVTTFYNNYYQKNLEIIHALQTKTKKLAVMLFEPTEQQPGDLDKFLKCLGSNVQVFGCAELNWDCANYQNAIAWFVDGMHNYYAETAWAQDLIAQLEFNYDKPKKFDCLLGKARSHRNIVAKLYDSSTVKNDVFFSYFQNSVSNGIWYNLQSESNNAELTTHRVLFRNASVCMSTLLPVEIYNQTYYSIVAETVCSNAYSQFTEKTAKPIIARRPFVVFAGQYYLQNLRKLGFKTFDGVIDESYDLVPDMQQRMTDAWRQVESLCQQDPKSVYKKLQPILDHNYDVFTNTNWLQNIHDFVSGATSRNRT